ncbi:MAG: Uma2 family endonuclease [Acidobacteria bacterium]|nr:Uma2 family endonuclease [Acidobacteriota bacterium]
MTAAPAPAPSHNYRDAIAHLPPGGTLIFQHVTWDEYEKLLEEMGAGYFPRISYDHGRLEIFMPLPIHEFVKAFTADLVRALTDELDLEMIGLGSTTFSYRDWLQGLEPDTCFFIQNAARVLGVRRFDPTIPPPAPDIAVEVDITSESLNRFPTYANLGVPEIWRYDDAEFMIYHLTETGYVVADASRAFPFLTAERLNRYLQRSQNESHRDLLREIRAWVRTQVTAAQ